MKTTKTLPEPLVSTRPAVANDPNLQHPENGAALGPPPQRYSRAMHDTIVRHIEQGMRPAQAAAMAGLPANTYYSWIKKGREGHPHLWEFAQDVERALAVVEGKAVAAIVGKGEVFEDSDNAKWFLERRFADGYSKEAATKVNAMLEDFFRRLEQNLPVITADMVGRSMFEIVIAAASGEQIESTRQGFKLTSNGSEEEDGDGSEEPA